MITRDGVLKLAAKGGVVIDFGFKSEGAVPIEEFTEAGELTVKRGDEVEVLIKSMESQEGVPILSRADAVRMRAWDELEKAYRDGVPVKGRIAERVKGGLRVDVDGVAAFLPGSQVDVRPIRNLESLRDVVGDSAVGDRCSGEDVRSSPDTLPVGNTAIHGAGGVEVVETSRRPVVRVIVARHQDNSALPMREVPEARQGLLVDVHPQDKVDEQSLLLVRPNSVGI